MGLFLYRQYINDSGVIQLNVIITGFMQENQMVASHFLRKDIKVKNGLFHSIIAFISFEILIFSAKPIEYPPSKDKNIYYFKYRSYWFGKENGMFYIVL